MSTYTLLNSNAGADCGADTAVHQKTSHLFELTAARCGGRALNVTAGYYGKAKTTLELIEPATSLNIAVDEHSGAKTRIRRDLSNVLSYGDDVGLVLNKTMYEREDSGVEESPAAADSSSLSSVVSSSKTIVNQFYFGVADGVSANRSRGYDPSLFPNALLHACANYILATDYTPPAETTSLLISSGGEEDTNNEASLDVYLEENEEENEEVDCENAEYAEEEDVNSSYFQLNEVFNMFSDDINDERVTTVSKCGSSQQDSFLVSSTTSVEESAESKYLFDALHYAHDLVQENKVYGSSTVCLLSLRMTHWEESTGASYCLLSTCNLGDSGYMIIRNRQVVFKSQTQSHRFNAPFQIGCTPPELLDHDLYRDK
jgi:hypothetical protein